MPYTSAGLLGKGQNFRVFRCQPFALSSLMELIMPKSSHGQFLFPEFLNIGSRGAAVVFMQQLLCALNFYPERITGVHTDRSVDAVMFLQRKLGFTGGDVDGNFGPGTRLTLYKKCDIEVNLIPARPDDVTHYVAPDGEQGVWPEK